MKKMLPSLMVLLKIGAGFNGLCHNHINLTMWSVRMLMFTLCFVVQIPGEGSTEAGMAGKKTIETVKAVSMEFSLEIGIMKLQTGC